MIRITVRVSFLTAVLGLFVFSAAKAEHLPDKRQQHLNNNLVESKSDIKQYEAGRSLAREKRYEEAIREFQRAISINSTDERYYDNLAFCLKELGRYDEAIDALNHALLLDQKDSYGHRELGVCYCRMQQFEKAIDQLQQSISLNPSDAVAHIWLGYSLHQLRRYDAAASALDEALKLRPNNFDASYWRGLSSLRAGRFEEASRSLSKAVELRPNDFNANFWRGMSLVRERKFKEAIPNFEKTHQIRRDDKASRLQLFACYLATQQIQKAFWIYPLIVSVTGGGLTFIYFVGLALLLPFTLPVRTAPFPGLRFSVAWLALFVEGQIAFFFLLPLLPWFRRSDSVLMAAVLAGLPIIIVAVTGFARQPWGGPFRFPVRFGTPKMIVVSLLLLFLTILMGAAFSQLYVQLTHKPFPLQRTIPLINDALRANAAIAWLAVGLAIPLVEEILFRGLLFGAFEKRWGIKGAMLGSSFLFVCIHLQIVGFFYLFCIGLVLGWARWKSGSLGLPVFIHALNNGLAMVVLTLQRT